MNKSYLSTRFHRDQIFTMKRRFISIFLITLFLFQSMDRFGLIAYYEINKSYITQMFCINKSRPELQCEGKCFLMQKLKEKEQSEEKIPAHVVGTKEIQLLPIQAMVLISENLPIFCSQPSYQETLDMILIVNDIFHPPQNC